MEANLAALLAPYFGKVEHSLAKTKIAISSWHSKGLKYLALLLVTLPLAFCLILPFVVFAMALHIVGRNLYTKQNNNSEFGKKTVLVTGAPHTKGLQVCRFMKSAGHRVILADMESFSLNAARFSMAVDRWISLPNFKYDPVGYEAAIMKIISDHQIDWWIPVSHTITAPVDCKIKAMMNKAKSGVKILSYDSIKLVEMLDDKIAFLEDCQNMGLAVPEFHQISSMQHLIQLRSEGLFRDRHFFLKPLFPYSEDRVNFSRIPHDEIQFQNYMQVFEKKIGPKTPYFVSEYIKGPEYTGNCISSAGELTLFTCNPSSPMQIDYDIAKGKEKQIFDWTKDFCKRRNITGSICFDFMEDPATGRMLAIECNPRLHSCIVLMKNQLKEAGEAFGRALELSPTDHTNVDSSTPPVDEVEDATKMAEPTVGQSHVIWLYNEIGKLAHVRSFDDVFQIFRDIFRGEDAVFDIHDPLPFFILGHVQMPAQIWAHLLSGKKWDILNFCLGQLR